MPDNLLRPVIEEKQAIVPNNNVQEGTLTKLQREADLLRGGIADGVKHRLSEPGELLRDSGIAFAGAYALKAALNAGGRWGTAAKIVGGICGVGAAADVVRRTVPTVGAMADTWKSGNNFEQNKVIVANNLGTALVDYPTMALAGYAGLKTAGHPKLLEFKVPEPSLRNIREISEPGKFGGPKDLNIKPFDLKPLTEYQGIRVALSYPVFPVVPVDLKSELVLLQGPKSDEKFEGLHKFFKDDVEANRAKRDAEAAQNANGPWRAPEGALNGHNAQRAAEGAVLGAVVGAAAAIGNNAKDNAAPKPKLELAPPPRQILQVEPIDFRKLMEQIPQRPQAFIELHHDRK